MKLYHIIILSLITYLCEGYILWRYCSLLFVRKYSVKKCCVIYFVLYSISVIFSVLSIPAINSILFFLNTMLIIKLTYKVTWGKSLFHAIIATFMMIITEMLILLLVPNYSHMVYNFIYNFRLQILIYFISKIFYFIAMTAIAYLLSRSSKKYNQIRNTKIIIPFFISLITAFTLITILEICLSISLPFYINVMIIISSVALLLINVLIIVLYNFIEKQNEQTTSLQLQLQSESLTIEHYKTIIEHEEDKNILLHDIRKHLQSIQVLNTENNNEQIEAYISNLINSSKLSTPKKVCDNPLLNAIIGRYIHLCNDYKIDFKSDIRHHSTDFLSNDDCTSLFCNLLDNAFEATKNTPDSFIELNIGYNTTHSIIVITLINSCLNNPFDNNGQLKRTTKTDSRHHGYGIKSIQNTIDKYNGDYNIYYNHSTSTFHTVIIFQKNTHNLSNQ